MINEILGQKLGMSQIFTEDGTVIPVTVVEAGSCQVVQRKSEENDGYCAVQLGFKGVRKSKVNKSLKGHFDKHGSKPAKILKEVRVKNREDLSDVKKVVTVDILFKEGDKVSVTGVTKGRGFAGVMKRYNMGGSPASRGSHEVFRHVGSLAGGASVPGRVWPGKRLPGRMGNVNRTILNLEIVRVVKKSNLLLIKGSVPGARGGVLRIRKTNRS